MPLRRSKSGKYAEWCLEFPEEEPGYPWLRTQPPPLTSEASQTLCWRCRQLDFSFLFRNSLSRAIRRSIPRAFNTGPAIEFGFRDDLEKYERCAFCSLVLRMLHSALPEDSIPKTNKSEACELSNQARVLAGYLLNHEIPADETNLTYHIEMLFRGLRTEEMFIQPIWQSSESGKRLCWGRRVSPGSIDFSIIRDWLNICEELHGALCIKSKLRREPSGLKIRLIDVQEGCLVRRTWHKSIDYAILSYVWGKKSFLRLIRDNVIALETPGAISASNTDIPRTIRDALTLCGELSERYLWVDSLCIVQDSQDKQIEINAMDAIYSGAKFTIVAAAGEHAEAGLPGVSDKVRDVEQHTIVVDNLMISNVLPDARKSVDQSDWNSRAWTFQERLLSQRLIVFTSSQAYFECSQSSYREDIFLESKTDLQFEPEDLDYNADTPYRLDLHRTINFRIYAQVVRDYTKRILTFTDDIENAVQGILKPLSESHFKSQLIYGVPMSSLDIALLWHPAGRLQRRPRQDSRLPNFPSWSWAGWVGAVYYSDLESLAERTYSEARWVAGSSEGTHELPGNWFGNEQYSQTAPPGWSRTILPDGEIAYIEDKPGNDQVFCRPLQPRIFNHSSDRLEGLHPVESETGYLKMIADVATFMVPGDHSPKGFYFTKCDSGVHDVCYLSVMDKDGNRAGSVVVDGTTRMALKAGLYSFIKLSRTTLTHTEEDPAWDEESHSFLGQPGGDAINPDLADDNSFGRGTVKREWFDPLIYNETMCWPMYNVLMIEWKGQIASRIGVGKIHVTPFDTVCSTAVRVSLG